ncbi:MAG: NrsF family protein [Beijerinckiaceae bacterium]
MKTHDLISTLAADLPTPQTSISEAAMQALPAAVAASFAFFLVFLGFRQELSAHWVAIAHKLLLTGILAGTALFVCMRVVRPEKNGPAMYSALALPLVVLAGLVLTDMMQTGAQGWQARAIGSKGLYCLSMIPLLSLAPLAAILFAARSGAVTQHAVAGSMAGLAAAGIGATLYALHCTDDSPLFVAFWYSLAALIMAVVGAIACRMTVRW